jgi:hypothetical protein
MPTRSWRRLAGCIAISCVLRAATTEYRAGAAGSDHVRAVVIEDRRGVRAVFAETDFPITRSVSDFIAIQLVKAHELDRAAIVLSGTGDDAGEPAAILGVIEEALTNLNPATLTFSGVLSVRTTAGACLATLYPVQLSGCREGEAVRGNIRAAFQMVDLPHPLQTRDAATPAYPVQAVAIGKSTILALGGEVPAGRYPGIVVAHANDTMPLPDARVVEAAIANVLRRVR